MLEQRKSTRRKKQGEVFNMITTTPIPYPLALAGARKRTNSMKVTLGIEGGKHCFDFFLTFIS